MGTRESLDTLIQGFQHKDTRLYDILRLLTGRIDFVESEIIDLANQQTADQIADVFSVSPPDNFTFTLPGTTLRLSWDAATDAANYEIRKGSSWATADFVLRTSSLSVDLNPILVGTHTYLIKSIDSNGAYSGNSTSLTLIIPAISDISFTYNVIDNNVLLYWSVPLVAPFGISYYNVYKDGVLLGTKNGTFTTIFETAAGDFIYGVEGVDLVGNKSPIAYVTVSVDEPIDFELIDEQNADYTGTFTNCMLVDGTKILAPIVGETWAEHFTNNSWANIADQIAAGYPLYMQPAYTSATYVETFDFSTTFTNTIIAVSWAVQYLTANLVGVGCEIAYSDDDITYSAYVSGTSIFAPSLRYVRVKLTFTPVNDRALVFLSNLVCTLDIKYGTDSGSVAADSTDVLGTPVLFNKSFKDVNSITVSVLDTAQVSAVYDFVDVPDPTTFYVFVFDAGGTRIDKTVSWKARGIV